MAWSSLDVARAGHFHEKPSHIELAPVYNESTEVIHGAATFGSVVMAKLPTAIGLSLCEQVIIEDKTHNVTLVNCFMRRTLDHFPSRTRFIVFAHLTGGLGEVPSDVIVQELVDMNEIHRISLKSHFASPLQVMRCIVRIRDCYFPAPGHYLVSLCAGGEIVAQRKFQLLLKE